MEDEIIITYETLFELLRKEKNNPELQKLSDGFYEETVKYLNEKKDSSEIKNIKRIIKELWERRERKITILALNKARTISLVVDTKKMLEPEKEFYENLLSIFTKARKEILEKLLEGKVPKLEEEKEEEDIMVRFLKEVDKFVGPELEVYGPFKKEDIAQIPSNIAKILIEKGDAEKID